MRTATGTRERGILFSDRLVRAILEGRKTQTRRVVKGVGNDNCLPLGKRVKTHVLDAPERGLCPYGISGDRLYVRECWKAKAHADGWIVHYRADGRIVQTNVAVDCETPHDARTWDTRWRPSIHMPKWASRIWLEITGVRVERVQDISDADAVAEGVEPTGGGRYWVGADREPYGLAVNAFRSLWDQTNAHRDGCTWDDNPWVWVIEFRRVER